MILDLKAKKYMKQKYPTWDKLNIQQQHQLWEQEQRENPNFKYIYQMFLNGKVNHTYGKTAKRKLKHGNK